MILMAPHFTAASTWGRTTRSSPFFATRCPTRDAELVGIIQDHLEDSATGVAELIVDFAPSEPRLDTRDPSGRTPVELARECWKRVECPRPLYGNQIDHTTSSRYFRNIMDLRRRIHKYLKKRARE